MNEDEEKLELYRRMILLLYATLGIISLIFTIGFIYHYLF